MPAPLPGPAPRIALTRSLILGDGIWAVGARLFTATSAVAIQLMLARLLTPADLGGYFIALSLSAPLAVIGQFGIGPIALREIAAALANHAPGQAVAVVARSLQIALLGAVGVLAGIGTLGSFVTGSITVSALCGLWAALLTLQGLLAELLRGFGRPRSAALLNGALGNLTTLPPLLAIWYVQATLPLSHALLILIGGGGVTVLAGGLGLWLAVRHGRRQAPSGALQGLAPAIGRPSSPSLGEMLRRSRPLLLNQVLLMAMGRADLWIVSLAGGAAQAAGYAIAARIAMVVALPLEIGRSAVAGRIATLHAQGDLPGLERLLRAVATGMLLGALPIALLGVGFGAPLISLIYGAAYAPAAPLLAILALGQLTNVATGLCGQTLTLTGHGALVLRVTLAASLASLGLMLALVGLWGALAVALVAAAGVALRTSLLLIGARRVVGVWTHPSICAGKRT